MTMLRINGLDTHVQQMGPTGPLAAAGAAAAAAVTDGDVDAAPTAVLIHGTATDSMVSWYLTLASPLADAGFRVILYDLRGHGRTERPPSGYRLSDFVDDLAALLDTLGVTAPVYLLGNSLGGTIAFGYAARHPRRVAAIVTVESSPPTPEWLRRIGRRVAAVAGRLSGDGHLPGEAVRRAEVVRDLLATTTIGTDLPTSPPPAAAELAVIRCPVLCLYGGNSAVAELAVSVEELLPQTRTVVVPNQGHTLLVRAPHAVRELVLPWLGEQIGARALHPAEPR